MKIALIPARKGSTRLPGKNLKSFFQKPLVEWTVLAAIRSQLFDKIIVSSDWEELLDYIEELQLCDVQWRPSELAQSDTSSEKVIDFVLAPFKENLECYCLLQPTSPLRNEKHIQQSYQLFKEHESCFSINMNTLKPNGAIYWSRDIHDLYKSPSTCYVMTPQESIDIDEITDFRIAEYCKGQLEQYERDYHFL